ncbi:MAG: MFS transporter [Clostridiales Family XIII bacterium]|jgi:MFS family permease|nr:MFS transporter [Clostridiales Family XIII bacterium]
MNIGENNIVEIAESDSVNHNIPEPQNHYNNSFKLLVIGQIVTLFGSSLLRFVLSLYVLDLTGRADIFAGLIAISTLPTLLSPIGGAIADRVNRRNLMVAIDFVNGLIVLGFIIIGFSGHVSIASIDVGMVGIVMVGVVMVLLGITSAMEMPTVMACVPAVAPKDKFEQANGIINAVSSLAQIIAPVLGGVLFSVFGLKPLVIFSCIAFFLASFIELFIRMPFVKRPQTKHMILTIFDDMKDGFQFAIKEPMIRKCMILAAVLNLFMTPYFIVGIPVILRITMHSSDTMYGIGMAAVEFGMILGALSMGLVAKKMQMNTLYHQVLWIAALLIPASIILSPVAKALGYFPEFVLFFLCVIPILMMVVWISIFVITYVQRQTPDALLGKVMAILMMVSQCVAPIGQLIYGAVLEKFSMTMYIPTAMIAVVTVIIAICGRNLLKL